MKNPENYLQAAMPTKHTTMIAEMQGLFPDCQVESDWLLPQAVAVAPYFAMRLACGATVIRSPAGHSNYVYIEHDCMKYLITKQDFAIACMLHDDFVSSYCSRYGCKQYEIMYKPHVIIDGLLWMQRRAHTMLDLAKTNKSSIFWLMPDQGACGYYRAYLPVDYALANTDMAIDLHTHYTARHLEYYDAAVIHRTPPEMTIGIYQRLKAEGRLIVYETDDDVFNIPEWSIARSLAGFSNESLERAKLTIEMADLISVSTDAIKESMIKLLGESSAKRIFVTPNLVHLSEYAEPPRRTEKKLDYKLLGKTIVLDKGKKVRLKDIKTGTYHSIDQDFQDRYDPITICWFGSNTHDGDLQQIVEPIKILIKRYGVSVRFIFFGYCPLEFVDAYIGQGNTGSKLKVKEEFYHSIEFVNAVSFRDFQKILNDIQPDIGLCPIAPHVFNLSKSNLKVIQFGAMKVPSVSSNFGPYAFVNDGVDGILVDGDGCDDWVNAIDRLITNKELRLSMGDAIYKTVSEEYSWQHDSDNRKAWEDFFAAVHNECLHRRPKLELNEDEGSSAPLACSASSI